MSDDINSDAAPDRGLVLVDKGAPRASYNPNPLWVLICSFQPRTGSLIWNTGRVVMPLPRVSQAGELRSVSYSDLDGNMSWIPLANRRQANLDSSGNPTNNDVLTLEDVAKGRKQVVLTLENNKLTMDSTSLNTTLTSYASRLLKAPTQIGARVRFDSTIICQWVNQTLSTRNIVRKAEGQFDISFPTPLQSSFGINASMQSNQPGIIQYGNVTEKWISVFTYDLQGKVAQFDGDFSFDIQT